MAFTAAHIFYSSDTHDKIPFRDCVNCEIL